MQPPKRFDETPKDKKLWEDVYKALTEDCKACEVVKNDTQVKQMPEHTCGAVVRQWVDEYEEKRKKDDRNPLLDWFRSLEK